MPPRQARKEESAPPNSSTSGKSIVVALIENGKSPDQLYNMSLGFWLPPDSPCGDFQLKLMKLCQRLDEANRRLIESFYYWNQARTQMPPGNVFERHLYANEQAVYLMRRAADEMIAMIWCLSQWEIDKDYPQQIEVERPQSKKSSASPRWSHPSTRSTQRNRKCLQTLFCSIRYYVNWEG